MKYKELISSFKERFGPSREVNIYSAPGRIEIGGNHTDHQGGAVLAAAINLESSAAVASNGLDVIRAFCEGHGEFEIKLSELSPRESEKNSTPALIRGVAAGLESRGVKLFGVDIYTKSQVLPGSGLSSSAAFEVLLGRALSDMCGAELSAEAVAEVGQYAEREFFGKPCGLMDQMASSVGGVVAIDFSKSPVGIEKIECDISEFGYDIVIIDAGADHADLTEEYAAIPREMSAVAEVFGKNLLSEVSENEFYENIGKVREMCGDRATLRAAHFFADDARARNEAKCLKNGDFDGFLKLVDESGTSSFKYLQNIYPSGYRENQAMAAAELVCRRNLGGRGAVRIQGGGFGGTLEAFVPKDITSEFINNVAKVLGENSCKLLSIRPCGGIKVK
ncbi:MAG: galactokinase [Oscillospiraceae bacterium]|nr:galactokinase [Oscillospiraceae bacterium]